MAMNSLRLIGKTSSDIFTLRYPNTLLDFCDFDFSVFAAGAIDICNEALKTGTPDYDRISDLRHDIQSAHCYIEHNIRTVYEKIVFDCWIDFVCRRDNIGVSGMWNRYIRCKTPFEKAIFARLCEFRYNRASNEWLNIIRIQDYAKTKLDFIFTDKVGNIAEATARRNYFDLIFSVTAREMGCRIEDLGVTKLFSVGRIPSAPFMFPNISKEIVRHVLPNFDYSDDYSDIGEYGEISDQISMDAFSRMKAGLPQDPDNYNIPNGKLDKYADTIYMPCSLKAAIDLEIDIILEEGSWLSRCKRCKRFFLRNSEHPEEYCSRYVHNGKTCLQIYEEEHPRPTMTPQLEARCRKVTDEMYSRVDKTMSVKEYDSWHLYLQAMINKVKNGEILPSELESFLDYSLEVDISKSRPIVEVAKKEPEVSKERVVKPFVPERISRSELAPPPAAEFENEEPEEPRRPQSKEGFFTSPSFQRQKSERAPISHIIRNGESMGENYTKKPDPAGFTPFGAPERPEPSTTPITPTVPPAENTQRPSGTTISLPVREEPRRRTPREELKRLEERLEEEKRLRREQAERARSAKSPFKPFSGSDRSGFSEEFPTEPSYGRGERSVYGDRTSEYGNTGSIGSIGSIGNDRIERDQFPQSRRERERSIQRRQGQPRQSDLSLAGYGTPDFDLPAFDNLNTNERPEPKDHGIRLNRKERVEDERLEDARFADNDRDMISDREDRSPIRMRRSEPEQTKTEENGISGQNPPESDVSPTPRRKVIRKNAAALSAYGKMSGTQFAVVQSERDTTLGTEGEVYTDEPDTEPFKDIGSIFDVLEQSQSDSDGRGRLTDDDLVSDTVSDHISDREPSPEWETASNRKKTRRTPPNTVPREVTKDNVPNGIWTEERNLFPDTPDTSGEDLPPEEEQADEVKERKHTRSNKTQRLFDVIMREPDDNPNFRK